MTPSPFSRLASATVSGLLSTAAQAVAGVKTFTSAIIASAGVQLASIWNTNGSGASDVCVKVGTTDSAPNFAAKLFSVRHAIGGSEVESFSVLWGEVRIPQLRVTGSVLDLSILRAGGSGFMKLEGQSSDASAAVCVRVTNNFTTLTNANARIMEFYADPSYATVKSAVMASGEFEHFVSGAGVVLKSPNGTRYRITVSNAGALVVAAA